MARQESYSILGMNGSTIDYRKWLSHYSCEGSECAKSSVSQKEMRITNWIGPGV